MEDLAWLASENIENFQTYNASIAPQVEGKEKLGGLELAGYSVVLTS